MSGHSGRSAERLADPSSGLPVLRALALLSALLAFPWDAHSQSLTVSSWGGHYGDSQRTAYFEPFTAATGIQIIVDDWGGDLAKIRAMVATGRYQSHALDAESSDVAQGCAEGILEPIDYGQLGLSPKDMQPGAAHPCGVGNVAWSVVLVFDRARLGDDSPERGMRGRRLLENRPEFPLTPTGVERLEALLSISDRQAARRAPPSSPRTPTMAGVSGALTIDSQIRMAEREGFEPSMGYQPILP